MSSLICTASGSTVYPGTVFERQVRMNKATRVGVCPTCNKAVQLRYGLNGTHYYMLPRHNASGIGTSVASQGSLDLFVGPSA